MTEKQVEISKALGMSEGELRGLRVKDLFNGNEYIGPESASEVVKQWAELEKDSSGPDKQAIRAEEVEAMMQCLREMDESLQVPLAMRYFCDLNSTEIGEILELEPGTVRKRLHKGRIILADALLLKGIKL